MRHPVLLAKELATLQNLSSGRLMVGAGIGWHGSRDTPEQTAAIVQRLRAERPGADFTISTRVNWDGRDLGVLRDRIAAYEAAGVQHVVVASDLLRSAEIDNWADILAGVGRLVG